DAILWTAWPRDRRLDRREIEVDDLRVLRLPRLVVPEKVLLAIRLHEREPLLVATGKPQVVESFLVHREEATRRAVFRRHVPERRTVGDRQRRKSGTEILDELPNHT